MYIKPAFKGNFPIYHFHLETDAKIGKTLLRNHWINRETCELPDWYLDPSEKLELDNKS